MTNLVEVQLEYDVLDEFDGKTLEEAKVFIDTLISKYPEFTNLKFNLDSGYSNCSLEVHGKRPENEKEREVRERNEQREKERKEKADAKRRANDLKLLAKLKKQYE